MSKLIRLEGSVGPFAALPISVLEDPRLSWKSKALYAYLWSRPPGWEVRREDLVGRSTDGKASTGAGIKELCELGLLVIQQTHRPDGRFTRFEWRIRLPTADRKPVSGELDLTGDRKSGSVKSGSVKPAPVVRNTESDTETSWAPDGPYSPAFEDLWKVRPRRDGNDPKRGAWRAYLRTLRHGHDHETLVAKVDGYAAWCRVRDKIGTESVMRLVTFLGPDEPWDQDWEVQLRLDRLDHDQRRREQGKVDGDDVEHHGPAPDEPRPMREPKGRAREDADVFLKRIDNAKRRAS